MAITKTGEQFIKEAVARWKDFIQNMSAANRNRLINSGVVKPQNAYINGINRGTVNILNRYGYTRGNVAGFTPEQVARNKARIQADRVKAVTQNDQIAASRNLDAQAQQKFNPEYGKNPHINQANPDSWDGMSTIPHWKAIYIKGAIFPSEVKSSEGQKLFNALANRHEAYEAIAAEKAYSNYLKNPQKGDKLAINTARQLDPLGTSSITDQQLIGAMPIGNRAMAGIKTPGRLKSNFSRFPRSSHINIDVLGKERKLMDTFPYKDNDGYYFLRNMRNREYEYMDRAGEYQAKQNPGLLGRVLTKLHLRKPTQDTPERYNESNFHKMTRKMKRKIPVPMGKGETWTPLY